MDVLQEYIYDRVGLDAGFLDEVSYLPGPTVPTVTSAPADQTIPAGLKARFTVSAVGTPPISYQWQFNGTDISGATNTSITVSNVQTVNSGTYSVVVSSKYGRYKLRRHINGSSCPTDNRVPTHWSASGGKLGDNFDCCGRGSEPFSYQWRFEENDIAGATNASVMLMSLQISNSGNYQVVVSNPSGTTVSSNAMVVVIAFDGRRLGK